MIYYKHSMLETIITLAVCSGDLLYYNKWQQYEEQGKNVLLFAFHIHLVNTVSERLEEMQRQTFAFRSELRQAWKKEVMYCDEMKCSNTFDLTHLMLI